MAHVMVLCAGHGTRLRPLTDQLPKPLVPIGDRPMLRHICDRLAQQGHRDVVANIHHLPGCFVGFDAGAVRLKLREEARIRGTAGGVTGARDLLADSIVVWNGDIWAEPELRPLQLAAGDGIALLVAPAESGQGTVGLDATGNVARLRGTVRGPELKSVDYVGIMALGEAALRALPAEGCLIGDLCLPWLAAGGTIRTVNYDGYWSDVGSKEAYLALNRRWLGRRTSFCGAGSQVAPEVRLEGAVVGAGASVTGTGELSNCVVWPDARVRGPLRDAVVLTDGEIVAVG